MRSSSPKRSFFERYRPSHYNVTVAQPDGGQQFDGEQAVQMASRLRPDVVLMDIRMPSLDGIEATRRLVRAHPSIRVLMLTTFGLDNYVFESLRAGASGFMLKDAPPEQAPVDLTRRRDVLSAAESAAAVQTCRR